MCTMRLLWRPARSHCRGPAPRYSPVGHPAEFALVRWIIAVCDSADGAAAPPRPAAHSPPGDPTQRVPTPALAAAAPASAPPARPVTVGGAAGASSFSGSAAAGRRGSGAPSEDDGGAEFSKSTRDAGGRGRRGSGGTALSTPAAGSAHAPTASTASAARDATATALTVDALCWREVNRKKTFSKAIRFADIAAVVMGTRSPVFQASGWFFWKGSLARPHSLLSTSLCLLSSWHNSCCSCCSVSWRMPPLPHRSQCDASVS